MIETRFLSESSEWKISSSENISSHSVLRIRMSESDGTENYQNWHPGLQYLNGQQQHLQQQFHHPSTAPHVVSLATNFIDVPNNQQQPHQQIQHQQQCESQNNFSNYELFGGSGGMGVETTCNNILTNLVSNIIPQPQYQQQQHVPSPPMMGAPAPGYLPQQQTPTRGNIFFFVLKLCFQNYFMIWEIFIF